MNRLFSKLGDVVIYGGLMVLVLLYVAVRALVAGANRVYCFVAGEESNTAP